MKLLSTHQNSTTFTFNALSHIIQEVSNHHTILVKIVSSSILEKDDYFFLTLEEILRPREEQQAKNLRNSSIFLQLLQKKGNKTSSSRFYLRIPENELTNFIHQLQDENVVTVKLGITDWELYINREGLGHLQLIADNELAIDIEIEVTAKNEKGTITPVEPVEPDDEI